MPNAFAKLVSIRQNGFLQENNHNFCERYRKGPRLKYTARKSKVPPNPFRRGRGQGTINLYQQHQQ